MNEMPTMTASNYASQNYNAAALLGNLQNQQWNQKQIEHFLGAQAQQLGQPIKLKEEKPMSKSPRRLVQVFICDPDENVSLADSLLYTGEQKLTDLTDQELFFEIDIKAILTAHNEKRAKMVNKAVKERTEYLEPARVRDLKMTVVNIATF